MYDNPYVQPEHADLPAKTWQCQKCGEQNWWEDAECQFCIRRFDEDPEPPIVPCVDNTENHEWVVSDEDENICYCSRCGSMEY